MTPKETLQKTLTEVVAQLYPDGDQKVGLESPKNKDFGDYASNIAMALAGRLKQKPRAIAEALQKEMAAHQDLVQEVSVAGPGFLNFRLKASLWFEALAAVQEQQQSYGQSNHNQGKKALIEFVSANPTGPLHIGHGRGAVVGDTLAALLQAYGYEVTREYYVNDGGFQIRNLGKSMLARISEINGETVDFPEDGYQGEYIIDLARAYLEEHSPDSLTDDEETLLLLGRYAGDKILAEIKAHLSTIGIEFDRFFLESSLYQEGKVTQVLEALKKAEMTFDQEGALWLASTKHGDDKDRVLIKQDGAYTYLTPDIAYHQDKFERGFDLLVNIWGADHAGYGTRLHSALTGLGYTTDKLKVLYIQMVNLIKQGQALSMSTRKAQYETLSDVVDLVGADVARYFFMMRSYQAQLDFDLELAQKNTNENPVYYIQYAHARICSIFAKAKEVGVDDWPAYQAEFAAKLDLPEEGEIAKMLLSYPEVIAKACDELAPHRVAFYVLELVRSFQSYYDKARHDARYKTISDDALATQAKLFFVGCVRCVIQNALRVLGVSAPEKM